MVILSAMEQAHVHAHQLIHGVLGPCLLHLVEVPSHVVMKQDVMIAELTLLRSGLSSGIMNGSVNDR